MHPKLLTTHLSRRAVVYVRQSTLTQLQGNQESQRRQYALVERAREMGFIHVEVIDEDLGRSAGGAEARPGFERLVSWVCAGDVGAIFCIEASRLARNGRDWHHLIDLCALTSTLLIDPDGVYDPRHSNDRLLLGLMGSMSEFELNLLRQRSFEAIRQKARRGELRFMLPVGLEWTRDDRIVLCPDLRIQDALRLLFRKVTELGSARKVLLWFSSHKIELPYHERIPSQEPRIAWRIPIYSSILHILRNPMYAGAYAFGKSESRTRMHKGSARKTPGHAKPTEQWTVLIHDHHPGYISFAEYERNQQMLAQHAHRRQNPEGKAARGGRALLGGLLRCRRCGRRLAVRYGGPHGVNWNYLCVQANLQHGSAQCLGFGGKRVDRAVSVELLRALAPSAIDAALLAAQQLEEQSRDVIRAVELERDEARYQVQLCARRYEEVDPANRLVALELERRWEDALRRLKMLEQRIEHLQTPSDSAPQPSREQLLSLARDLPAVWNHPQAQMALKQRLCRLLVQEIVCDVDAERSEVVLVLHWHGGRHSELRVPKLRGGAHQHETSKEAAEVLCAQAGHVPEEQIAVQLSELGLRTGTGRPWTAARVRAYLLDHRLETYRVHQSKGAGMTLAEAAKRLDISSDSVRNLIHRGIILATQVMPSAPYRITPEALERPEVRAAVSATLKHPNSRRSRSLSTESLPIPSLTS